MDRRASRLNRTGLTLLGLVLLVAGERASRSASARSAAGAHRSRC
ncbi:hypothetical protein ACFQHO_14140 [Actinomadura yumaensis]